MKLISWNCNQAFRKKYQEILQLDPDIIIIPECEDPTHKGDWTQFSDWTWIGENKNQGLGIFTLNEIKIQSTLKNHNVSQYSLPATLNNGIKLIGIWAKNDKQNPQNRYIAQVYNTIQEYKEWINSNTYVAGDFNWNATFTKSKPLHGNFTDTIQLLNKNGLHSTYHSITESKFGQENNPTFFMHKKENQPHHIDYIFTPDRFSDAITEFSIGTYREWIHTSDHMPLILEIK